MQFVMYYTTTRNSEWNAGTFTYFFAQKKNLIGDVMVVMKNRDCIHRKCFEREKGLYKFYIALT